MEPLSPEREREPLVMVRNLKKHFPIRKGLVFNRKVGAVKAVDDISFDIHAGETLGVVGESGCGKSTTGRAILSLEKPTAGSVVIDGREITELGREEIRKIRPEMQMIFQDSYASLNPRHSIGNIIAEPMQIHTDHTAEQMRARVMELLELVGLNPNHYNRFPHEFSGGQRQRINIARALS
ncbi:MAG: dipeptide/oligopeptide/nickel ABC transporter ATP-binding protein, partial [Desulfobacterales bacterium]|nr:dipeptide/oligopeptide/nickel ABC transporter ATP-binding protein [Desulfobacterales bacterium]